MAEQEKDSHSKDQEPVEQDRRNFLKGSGAVAGGLAATAVAGASTASAAQGETENPHGSRPGGGISLPDYYRPWAAIKNRNMYLPGTKIPPKNEMRISFLGSTPYLAPSRRAAFRMTKLGLQAFNGLDDYETDMSAFEGTLSDEEIWAVLA